MFSNALIFRLPAAFNVEAKHLEAALESARFLACGPTQAESSGWIAPRGQASTLLVERIGKELILKLQVETKSVPASVLARKVDAQAALYTQETGRDAGTKIKKEFKEEALLELLPHAFAKQSAALVWIDPINRLLVIDAASLSAADKVLSRLVQALAEIPGALPSGGGFARPLQTRTAPSTAMAHWLSSREAPPRFSVDRDCVLKAPDDSKASVRYANHALDIDEVVAHVAAGKVPTQLALTWSSRVSLVLGELGQLSRIRLLDGVLDDKDASGQDPDYFDADTAIALGELSLLIPDLVEALGGEVETV